jgi:hypothetical protein
MSPLRIPGAAMALALLLAAADLSGRGAAGERGAIPPAFRGSAERWHDFPGRGLRQTGALQRTPGRSHRDTGHQGP